MNPKKILIAVDGSENSIRAVQYVAEMAACSDAFSVQLLCIERFPDRDLFPDEASWKTRCEEQSAEMRQFLEDCRDTLLAKGLRAEAISERYIVSCKSPFADRNVTQCSMGTSIAQEILNAAKEGGFGTLVVGRRGVSKAEMFLFGSVSNKIIHHAKGCAVWVVA